jgi:hypothetical protein
VSDTGRRDQLVVANVIAFVEARRLIVEALDFHCHLQQHCQWSDHVPLDRLACGQRLQGGLSALLAALGRRRGWPFLERF